jgi:hypothetical protein
MDSESTIGLIITAVGAVAALLEVIRGIRRTSPQDRLLKDLEIRDALHANSDAQRAMDRRIHAQVTALCNEKPGQRDPIGIGTAVAFLVLGVPIGVWISITGGWWWLLSPIAAFLLLFGIVGLFESASRKERGNAKRTDKK